MPVWSEGESYLSKVFLFTLAKVAVTFHCNLLRRDFLKGTMRMKKLYSKLTKMKQKDCFAHAQKKKKNVQVCKYVHEKTWPHAGT